MYCLVLCTGTCEPVNEDRTVATLFSGRSWVEGSPKGRGRDDYRTQSLTVRSFNSLISFTHPTKLHCVFACKLVRECVYVTE